MLIGGNSGVGKTLTVTDFLEQTEEKYVWQAKSFSAQTSARALQAFFEEQLEKIRNDQRSLYAETCKAAGLDPDPKLCAIDLEARTVTKRAAPTPAK